MSNTRGQFSLFDSLFRSEKQLTAEPKTRSYGIPDRNTLLVHRYYFHAELRFYRYGKCLSELEREFFLSEARLTDLLSECRELVKQVFDAKPSITELQSKYPWLNWSA